MAVVKASIPMKNTGSKIPALTLVEAQFGYEFIPPSVLFGTAGEILCSLIIIADRTLSIEKQTGN